MSEVVNEKVKIANNLALTYLRLAAEAENEAAKETFIEYALDQIRRGKICAEK